MIRLKVWSLNNAWSFLIICVIIVPLVLFCTQAPEVDTTRTFYVSKEGDDNNDGLTDSTAWRSADRVTKFSDFEPGDKILFRRGDTFNHLLLESAGNGTSSQPIIIGDYGDEQLPKPILDARGRPKSKSLYLKNMSHIVIKNLSIRGAEGYQVYINPESSNCDTIKIINCRIDGKNGEDGIRFETDIKSGEYYGVNGVEIAYNEIVNSGQGKSEIADGIKAPNIQSGAYIHHNKFYNNVSEAIDIGAGKNHLVAYNFIDGNNGYDSGGIKTLVQTGNGINDTEDITIRNNVFVNCVQSSIQIQDGRNIKVFNNSVYSNSQGKLVMLLGTADDDQYDPDQWIWGNEIKNNILYGNEVNPDQAVIKFVGNNQRGPAMYWDENDRYDFQNNIIYAGDDPEAVLVRVRTKIDEESREFLDFSEDATTTSIEFDQFTKIHPNNFVVNPLYSESASGNLTIAEGSPAINQGIPVGLTDDFEHKELNGAPDIGAYEFQQEE